jgi:hypothetical protein
MPRRRLNGVLEKRVLIKAEMTHEHLTGLQVISLSPRRKEIQIHVEPAGLIMKTVRFGGSLDLSGGEEAAGVNR